ncbi:MAG: prolyl aminopeptidase [Pseudomonadota bacterium]
MSHLYPFHDAYDNGYLKTPDGHSLFYEQCGHPEGKPVIFLHGGPGLGCLPNNRRFFDPERYRVILLDQRGAGKSKPFSSLENNTTWHLVADIEQLRDHLNIEKWQVFGGSWGSTLALAYAQSHADRVTELVVRGIFLLRHFELQWFYQEGASYIFPEAWCDYINVIPPQEREDLIRAYHRRLTHKDRKVRVEAAKAWSVWEGSTSELRPNPDLQSTFGEEDIALSMARIENHYFVNKGFFESENQLLEKEAIDKICHLPGAIVQGRYDMVTPIRTALDLYEVWPEAEMHIVPDAGHSAYEPGMVKALIDITDRFAAL